MKKLSLLLTLTVAILLPHTRLSAQEYTRLSIHTDTAIVRSFEYQDGAIIYTQEAGQGRFHYHTLSSNEMMTIDLPNNIIVKDFEIYGNKILNFCGYIPGNPDMAVVGHFCVCDLFSYTDPFRLYYAVLPEINGARINRLNRIDCSKRDLDDYTRFNVVAVGDWNGNGHCVVEIVPQSGIMLMGVTWDMGVVIASDDEIFDDVAITKNHFVTVSRIRDTVRLRCFVNSPEWTESHILTNDFWRTNIIQITCNPLSPYRITGLPNDSVIVVGYGVSPHQNISETQIFQLSCDNDFIYAGNLNYYFYAADNPVKDARYYISERRLNILQQNFQVDGTSPDVLISFWNSPTGPASKITYTPFKTIYSFGEHEHYTDTVLMVGETPTLDLFLVKSLLFFPNNCTHRSNLSFDRAPIRYELNTNGSPMHTSFSVKELILPIYEVPVNTICQ
ncbi:MAG: hypothetical protein IJ789_07880 [Bacteroidales bacterium]|nr:hypothetical protein [Bacteroidales bacterium]